jgi:uncharacterized protein YndB with AHSA1/START domain
MAPLRSSVDIAAPPDVVWNLISRYEHWSAWGVSITAVEPSSGRVRAGATGRVRTLVGVWLPFEITEVAEGESWSWKVAGVSATGHRVDPTAGGCRVTFFAPGWAPFYLPVLAWSLQRLARQSSEV